MQSSPCITYKPPDIEPAANVLYTFTVPDAIEYRAAVFDALGRLTRPAVWGENIAAASEMSEMIATVNEAQPVTSDAVPVGTILMFAGSNPPAGYLLCAGGTRLKADFPELAAVLGSIYGSASSTSFWLPDMRGRLPRGFLASGPIGTTAGAQTVTLTAGNLPAHTHAIPARNAAYDNGGTVDRVARGVASAGASSTNTAAAGDGEPFDILPPVLHVGFIIKALP